MLRLLVVLLLLANAVFYAWTQGKLDDVIGVRAQGDREPERLTRQVQPQRVRVLPPTAAGPSASMTAAANVAAAAACLEVGPYTPVQLNVAENAMQSLVPAGSWVNVKSETAPEWSVYMGRYTDPAAMQKKIDELKRLRIPFEEVRGSSTPELDNGLSLGRFDNRAAADRALADFTKRGVRTARVVQLSASAVTHMLRIESADAVLQTKLAGPNPATLLGKVFGPCAK